MYRLYLGLKDWFRSLESTSHSQRHCHRCAWAARTRRLSDRSKRREARPRIARHGANAQDATENCPRNLGPNFDFGASPTLHSLPGGRRLLLARQKSGQVFAHDPHDQGRLVWKSALVDTIGESEILFGGAADERAAYFGLDNGSLAALDPATGQRKWFIPPRPPGPRRGVTAALTAIPGVVFAGGQDGTLRAYASGDGRVLWTFNMRQDFTTVNRVPARGGSMGAPGPVVAGGMLLVGSGYVGLGNGTPGNVLLAFGLP